MEFFEINNNFRIDLNKQDTHRLVGRSAEAHQRSKRMFYSHVNKHVWLAMYVYVLYLLESFCWLLVPFSCLLTCLCLFVDHNRTTAVCRNYTKTSFIFLYKAIPFKIIIFGIFLTPSNNAMCVPNSHKYFLKKM